MSLLMGIDIGTTSTRTIVVSEAGDLRASAVQEYPLSTPRPLWSEQEPRHWWEATRATIRQVLTQVSPDAIKGVGLSGQMHGLVLLDAHHEVLRPAILWNDQRTARQCAAITEKLGPLLVEQTCNPVLTGFTAGKILWVREHEPEIYARVRMMLLPKDYVRFQLTGEFATEVSDASGTSLFHVPERRWATEILERLEIAPAQLPRSYESHEISGRISKAAGEATGLAVGTPVVGGGGDQAAAAVGMGIVQPGGLSLSLGTSGVVLAFAASPVTDPQLRTHTFCHAVANTWHVMGVMLSAGGSLRWFRDELCAEESGLSRRLGKDPYELITEEAEVAPPGCEGLLFLPYLTGERCPYADPYARGAFVGLTLRHGKPHLARAVLEGVAFGLRDSLEIIKEMAGDGREVRLTGGGARSSFWRQIQADILGHPLALLNIDEGPAFGVALLAGVGAGVFRSAAEACAATLRVTQVTEPDPARRALYDESYARYRELYPALRTTFAASADAA